MERRTDIIHELFSNWKVFEMIYVSILLLLQVVAYIIAPDSIIGMISGITGVLCLVYGMKGKKVTFLFGVIQCLGMTYIAFESQAYGSFIMNIVYVISQPIGWFMWGKDDAIHSFNRQQRNYIFIGAFLSWLLGWFILAKFHGQLPYFDSINLVVSLIAQTLYIFKYKENWNLWIVVNVANVLYWSLLTIQFVLGNSEVGTLGGILSQVALQLALLFNSIYATKVWAEKNQTQNTEM